MGRVWAFFVVNYDSERSKLMGFEQDYMRFVEQHRGASNGERKRRLESGVGHGEKLFLESIWWEGFGHFNYLHPEYEVVDDKGKSRFIDFAYMFSWFKIAFEIQGYGPHLKQVSRWSYSDEQQRIRSLSSAGWILMYFSYDELKDNPEHCLKEIHTLLGSLLGKESGDDSLSAIDKEIIRLAAMNNGVIQTKELYMSMKLHRNTIYNHLRGLVEKKWLEPGGKSRNYQYRLNRQKKHLFR
jgi:DNA-binding CsgD family transcriptional regulator